MGKAAKSPVNATATKPRQGRRSSVPQRLTGQHPTGTSSVLQPPRSAPAHHAPSATDAIPAARPREIVVSGAARRVASAVSTAPVVRLTPRVRVAEAVQAAPLVQVSAAVRTRQAAQPTQLAQAVQAVSVAPAAGAAGVNVAAVATAGGAALMGLGMIVSGALGYIQTIAMTHMVTRSIYGTFIVVFTTVTFVSQISKIGLDGVLLRFLSTYRTRRERSLAAGLIRFTLLGPTATGLICAALLFLLAPVLSRVVFHSDLYSVPFREAAVLIPLIGLQGMLLNGLCAMKDFKWQVLVGKVIEPIATPVLMVVFFLLGLRLEALIYAYVISIAVSIIAGWIAFRRATHSLIRAAAPAYAPKTWVRFGSAMLVNLMTTSVIQSTDVLSLGAFSTATQVSLYRVADRVSSLIAMPFFALSAIFSPTIAELHARGDHTKLESMFALVTRWSFTLSWPICLVCVLFPDPILRVFGAGYTAGAVALYILAAGNMINAATGPVAGMLAMTGRIRILWFNTVLRVVLNLGLIFVLVPRYNILGAAEASSLTVAVFNVVAIVEVWWTMKLQPYRWELLKPIVAGAVASVIGWLLLRVTDIRPGSGVQNFVYACCLVVVFLTIYALALARLGLTSDDRAVFTAVRAKFRIRRA